MFLCYVWFEINHVKVLQNSTHMITFREVTHNEILGNMKIVQVLRDEIKGVELEN